MIYDIAGLRIEINNRCGFTERFCQGYLSEDQTSPATFSVVVTNEEFYEEKKQSQEFSDGYIENICLYRNICNKMPLYNRMLLHAAILEYDGAGYAFLGKSGTGKSTHTGLWLNYLPDSKIVNGDKPILEYKDGEVIAYGTPWNGKEGLGYKTNVPLKGLCFLEQAKENCIRQLTPAEVSSRLFIQVLIPPEEETAVATLEFMDKMITSIPAYLLKCDISEEAVKTSFEALTKKQYKKQIKGEK